MSGTGKGAIEFFGKIDRNRSGKVGSSVPAWAMNQHMENLTEEVASKKRALERGEVPMDKVMEWREEIKKGESKLESIKESRPKLDEAQHKIVEEAYKKLGGEISDAMFTRSEMHLGLADAHEEARRLTKPCIKIDANIAEMCEANSVKVTKDDKGAYLTRKDAELLYKYCGYYLGANTNTERLRKDKATARTATVRPQYYDFD